MSSIVAPSACVFHTEVAACPQERTCHRQLQQAIVLQKSVLGRIDTLRTLIEVNF